MSTFANSHLHAPVFILGLHRSGTTWLYEMLAQSGHFDIVTAGHVICFDQYRSAPGDHASHRAALQGRYEQLGLTTRGTEAVRLSPDTPEEYGFILDNHGTGPRLTRKNLPLFEQIARTVRCDPATTRRLLLKNPWDLANTPVIKQLLPDAKFIFIHRNPFHVLSSNYRMWVTMTEKQDPYIAMLSKRYARLNRQLFRRQAGRWVVQHMPGLLVRGLTLWIAKMVRGYLRNLAAIPPEDRIEVTYEALCENPNASIEQILRYLNVESDHPDYASQVAARPLGIAEPVAAQRRYIIRKLSGYASAVGYDLEALAREINPGTSPS